jgi:hypothetical protein
VFLDDKKRLWIRQPHLIKKWDKKFSSKVSRLEHYQTPGTPGVGVSIAPELGCCYSL